MKVVHKMKDNYISSISAIFILLVGMVMTGCESAALQASRQKVAAMKQDIKDKNAFDTLDYVRQHKGEGLRRAMAGSEAELMNTAVKSMVKDGYTIVREPHAVFAKAGNVNLSYAFYFYPSQTNGQTDVEVLVASPWANAENIQKYQEGAFSTTLFDVNRQMQEKGYDPNVKVGEAMLALSTAALDGDMKTAKKLIHIGANPDLAINELNEYASKMLSAMHEYASKMLSAMNKYISDVEAIDTGSEPRVKPDPQVVNDIKLKVDKNNLDYKLKVDKANLAIEILNGLKRKVEQIEAGKLTDARFQEALRTRQRTAMNPQMPEAARRYKVLAEEAVREKKFDDAIDLFGKALDIAPLWPEGHFNRALVLGETGDYEMAVREMKRYLLLAPDAPNARAAQDKIYVWESKAGEEN